jgi:hypothetical protein
MTDGTRLVFLAVAIFASLQANTGLRCHDLLRDLLRTATARRQAVEDGGIIRQSNLKTPRCFSFLNKSTR